MARNGSGTYSLPSGNPVVSGSTISSNWANNTLSDIATALTGSLAKDGQTVPTANIPMGGFKLTGLAAATSNGDALRFEQLPTLASLGAAAAGANSDITSLSGTKVPTIQVITATGTYTAPAGLRLAMVEIVGGGGGGSGAAAADRGNGGAGGGYSKKLILAATIGASQSVTIGAGGAGGAAGANVGIAGGTTSFGALFSATGGAGGVNGGSAGSGALGGIGSGGDINLRGNSGGISALIFSTAGGNSMLGSGGGQVVSAAGQSGNVYGGGGGGADGSGATARAGGAGAAGVAIVTEFYQ
jgi:hypothetical protein